MRATSIGWLAIAAAVATLGATVLLWNSSGEPSPATPPFTVPGTPADVYDAILPEIRDRIARDTKIVRIDSGGGPIVMRFSAYLEDHSVRLVEVTLTTTAGHASRVAVDSKRFSFLPGRSRDTQDATLEASLGELIRRRTTPAAPQP